MGHTASCYQLQATDPSSEAVLQLLLVGDASNSTLENIQPYSFLIMLNAMLWPTLLFIGGFVGIFISSIYTYKEQQVDTPNVHFYMGVSGIAETVV